MAYGVFVSYSWKNSAERRSLTAEVSSISGVRILADRDFIAPGDPVHSRILEMIDAADCVVVFLTPEGLASREVLDEITRAHDRKKHIIPVVAQGTTLEALPWYIRDLSWITYNETNFDAVLDSIVTSIRRKVNPLALVDSKEIPEGLNALISNGARFLDVPPSATLGQGKTGDHIFLELRMRDTKGKFVVRVPASMQVSTAAEFLVTELLPHVRVEDYDWVLIWNSTALPAQHTFLTAGIPSGEAVYLLGNHRMPMMWAPYPAGG